MAVTHTGGEISPLHYLALARDADGVELGDRENLKALFDAGLSGDETTLYMRVFAAGREIGRRTLPATAGHVSALGSRRRPLRYQPV